MNKQIRKILKDLYLSSMADGEYDVETLDQAETAIKEYIEQEIIGKDEYIPKEKLHLGGVSQAHYDKRNKLRAEQRDRLNG